MEITRPPQSRFYRDEGWKVTLVLANIYDDWPRIRRTRKEPRGMFRVRALALVGWQDPSKNDSDRPAAFVLFTSEQH